MNTIDIVTPTMWRDKNFVNCLEKYCDCEYVDNIFIIDNDKQNRPKSDIFNNKKITLIDYGTNIYVNPAWNEGYYRSRSDIMCLLNDDIDVHSDIFEYISQLDFSNIDIIGTHLKGSIDNFHIVEHPDKKEELIRLQVDKTKPIGGQSYAYGVCMFIKRSCYKPIPSLYKIWYGDDYLIQNCENIFSLKTSKIKGEISKTLVQLVEGKQTETQKRLDLDSRNAYKYNHFLNVKNWDHPKLAMQKNNTVDLFEHEYQNAKNTPSDINENVHILYELAKECETVIEMGVRTGVSTRAFLNTDVKLISFDLYLDKNVQNLFQTAKNLGKHVEYIQDNVLDIELTNMDLLFIDTYHVYDQLKRELELHGNKAQKYIVFHDTYTFGLRGEDVKDDKGLMTAIIEFMIDNPHWKFKIHKTNNNGLTVLERHK